MLAAGVVASALAVGVAIRKWICGDAKKEQIIVQRSLLELNVPEGELAVVAMSCVLKEAVRVTQGVLYVHLVSPSTGTLSLMEVRRTAATVYRQVWNEAQEIGHDSLQCIVLCNCPESRLANRQAALDDHDLEMIMGVDSLFFDGILERVRAFRMTKSLPELQVKRLVLPNVEALYNHLLFDDTSQFLPLYGRVAVGGTFDRLHAGHRILLTVAASVCTELLYVGVMSDEALKEKPRSHLIQPVDVRRANVRAFLETVAPTLRVCLFTLYDPAGPCTEEESLEALVLSHETLAGGEAINEKRRAMGWNPLQLVVKARWESASLSSSSIRRAEKMGVVGKLGLLLQRLDVHVQRAMLALGRFASAVKARREKPLLGAWSAK